jgi:citrate lyase beta subunit
MIRPRRTLLLTPGHRRERLEKAFALGADAVCFDLEDGVPPSRKPEAREVVAGVLRAAGAGGPERVVRINGWESGLWQADLAALPLDRVDAILLPKVENAAAMLALADALDGYATRIIATIETPRGIFNALVIADATNRIDGIFFGPGDYTMQTGGSLSTAALAYPRSVIAAAAGAVGCQAIDAPYLIDIKDEAATARDGRLARELGFSGKVAFHPAQIAAINAVFTPTEVEVERAERIVRAWHAAQAAGEAVVFAEGEFIAMDLIPRLERIIGLSKLK